MQQLELPFYAKYLLIAAFLASHNDAKLDKRLFMKNHGKQRKRLQDIKSKATVWSDLSTRYNKVSIFQFMFLFSGEREAFNAARPKIIQSRPIVCHFLRDHRRENQLKLQFNVANTQFGQAEASHVCVGRKQCNGRQCSSSMHSWVGTYHSNWKISWFQCSTASLWFYVNYSIKDLLHTFSSLFITFHY